MTSPAAYSRPRLGVLGVDADVADVRIGQRDDLPGVGRIGQDLLVAGHRGVEHDLAGGVARRADRAAAEDRAVGQARGRRDGGQQRGPGRSGGSEGHDESDGALAPADGRGRQRHRRGSGRAKRERPPAGGLVPAIKAADYTGSAGPGNRAARPARSGAQRRPSTSCMSDRPARPAARRAGDEARGAQRARRRSSAATSARCESSTRSPVPAKTTVCSPTTSPPRSAAKPMVPGSRSPVTPSRA